MDFCEVREERIMKGLREGNFKNHRAELIECGDVTILKWKAPNTGEYYIRYVFDGNNLYITGDVGEAVFKFTGDFGIHSAKNMWVNYFFGKMCTCSNGEYEFDNDAAVEELKKWKEERIEDWEDCEEREELEDTIDEIIEDLGYHYQDMDALIHENEEYKDFLENNGAFDEGWIYRVGQVIPHRNYAFLVGLQMASEQLRGKENE